MFQLIIEIGVSRNSMPFSLVKGTSSIGLGLYSTIVKKRNNNTYTIGDKNGDYNIIEISNHRVRCIESNCKDQICVNHGYLHQDIDNDVIICAPHKLVIQYANIR